MHVMIFVCITITYCLVFTLFTNPKKNELLLINVWILLAKYHIHRCTFSGSKPLFSVCLRECKLYVKTIESSLNKSLLVIPVICFFNLIDLRISTGFYFYFILFFVYILSTFSAFFYMSTFCLH